MSHYWKQNFSVFNKILCLLIICFAFIINNKCNAANILAYFPTPSISHQVIFRAYTEELAKHGHRITSITTDPFDYTKQKEYENITQIDLHDISYKLWHEKMDFAKMRMLTEDPGSILYVYYGIMEEILEKQFEDPSIQALINTTETYDLFVGEYLIPALFVFADKFNIPSIGILSLNIISPIYSILGGTSHAALNRDMFSLYYDTQTFIQRVHHVIRHVQQHHYFFNVILPVHESIVTEKLNGLSRSLLDTYSNVDMVLMNNNEIISGMKPVVPSLKILGNMHIKGPKPLPKDLKELLDRSTNGVIYFSFGTNVLSKQLPDELREMFIAAFKELPYTVLWKWETNVLPQRPDNVIISKWYPQLDVLRHHNVKLFITQGGYQSIEEAIEATVPIIGVPFIADQFPNVYSICKAQGGISLPADQITKDTLIRAINETINDKSYRQNMERLRNIVNDEPWTPQERSVWWTEYVLRHNGAKHLRLQTVGMPLYQSNLTDVYLFILVVLILIIVIVFTFVKYLIRSILYLCVKQKTD